MSESPQSPGQESKGIKETLVEGQRDTLKAMFVQGHASNSITRVPESVKGLAGLELLVVADPHPTTWASLAASWNPLMKRISATRSATACTSGTSRFVTAKIINWPRPG